MVKNSIHLNEDKLKGIIRESVKRIISEIGGRLNESMLKDYNEFDNVPDDFVESLDGQYYEVTVPDWCLPYLVNGDEEGYTEEEIGMMNNFIDSFNGKLWYGLNVGDACVPMDGVSPSFCSSNDVGGDACDCYRFCLPMKEAERNGVNGELNETRLKRVIRESINEVLNGDLDDDEVVEYMDSFDSEESGSFNVVQYKVTLGDGYHHGPEKILDKTGLSKEEAWEVFKKAAEYAYKYDWKSVSFYGTKDYIEWPIVSSEVDGVLGKRRVSFPEDGAFEIANVIENAKKRNSGDGGYKELCGNFLKHAKETFFSGKHEYHSW